MPVVKAPAVTQNPGSLASELSNPATWLTIASYVPTAWALFNLPTADQHWAVQFLKVAAVLCGPIATAAYAVAHAVKVKAGQSRWAAVEGLVIQEANNFVQDPDKAITWITSVITALHASTATLQGPAGPVGPTGPKGDSGQTVFVKEVPSPSPAPDVTPSS